MSTPDDQRRIYELQDQIADCLDPHSGQRTIIGAYLNAMMAHAEPANRWRVLADGLRGAAAIADELADLHAKNNRNG